MAFIQNLIQKWTRITLGSPGWFLAAAVFLFYFCCISFAFLLAMVLAGLTHNVFASFNISVGVLLGTFGCGIARCPEAKEKKPATFLLKCLLGFSVGGALAAFYLKVSDFGGLNTFGHSLTGYALLASLGYVSGRGAGFFQPILSFRESPSCGEGILKAGAGGVFLGALCFAFLFYSRLGVITSLLFVGCLSSVSALCLPRPSSPGEKSPDMSWVTAHMLAVPILFLGALLNIFLH